MDGKKNRKGIEYDYDGYFIFEGEYIKDKKGNVYGRPTGCGIAQRRFLYIYKNGEENVQTNDD